MQRISALLGYRVAIVCAFALGCTGAEIVDDDQDPSAAADLTAPNLLSNPSFEVNTTHWSSYHGTISRVALPGAPSGSYVAKVARTTGVNFSIDDYPGEVRTAAAGATYRASAQVRTASGATGRSVYLVLREYSSSGAVLRQTSSAGLQLTTSFRTLSVSATAAQSGGRMNVYLYQAGATSGDAFFIDAISLVQTSGGSAPDMGGPLSDLGGTNPADLGSAPTTDGGAAPTTRDPLKWPFAATSIWNMPIGSGAEFVPANFLENSNPGNSNIWAPFPGMDQEHIVLTPTAPLTDVYFSGAAWTGANRCGATGTLRTQVPMPSDYVVPNGGGNDMAAFLMPDNRSIVEMQPFARCNAGGYGTSLAFWSPTDLYGDGRLGSHGGSGLSGFGGSLRLGELRPGQHPPRHALKFTVYANAVLYNCSVKADCFRWPAVTADTVALSAYGSVNNNSNTAMKMGTLLAIPGTVDINALGLETEPGRQLAWTLQNYGAYIVDNGAAPGILISTENGPAGSKIAEFQQDYGYAFMQKVAAPNPWLRDIQRLAKALAAVNNNSPSSIGGGGTPRQPLAPPLP